MTDTPHIPPEVEAKLDEMFLNCLHDTETPFDERFRDLNQQVKALFTEHSAEREVTGETSDGYHTFNELYEFRMLYNAAFFNELHKRWGGTVKSFRHSDGELCFGGGWFVVTAQLPTGQITNHYEEKDWNLFKIPAVDKAPEWDGHTPQDVAKRLRAYLSTTNKEKEL